MPGDLSGLPEAAAAATGLRPFDGLRLALELAGQPITAEAADAWAEDAAARVRPHLIRTFSTRDGLESVWRHSGDVPASWKIPTRVNALVLHSVAGRLGVECHLVCVPPSLGLRVEDLDCDYVLTSDDGCLEPAEGREPVALRSRAVLAAAVEAFDAGRRDEPAPGVMLCWARITAALKPSCEASRVRLAEALLQTGRPASAYDLSSRLAGGVLGPEAVAIRDRAEQQLADRN